MNIRAATNQDIPQIVALLKMSLGESLMPKSEAYWQWKHIDNPFGPSPVLVAEESGELIGVRAFMRWEWTDGDTIYKAIRAVDTATHPLHQGKGIFKKLTLALLETCKSEGVHFVFNTPNIQSRPGYLKMGWQDAGRLPVQIFLGNPLLAATAKWTQSQGNSGNVIPLQRLLQENNVESLLREDQTVRHNYLATNYSLKYTLWRYCQVPVADYHGIYIDRKSNSELVVYRLKSSKIGTEFRITDYFGNQAYISSAMLKSVRKSANQSGATFITFSGTTSRIKAGLTLQRGPIVTIRDLQFTEFSRLSAFHYWQPSFGDLELF